MSDERPITRIRVEALRPVFADEASAWAERLGLPLQGEADIVAWAHEHMATYKSPRLVEFVDSLPKSGTGKIQWRQLQEEEAARHPAERPQ